MKGIRVGLTINYTRRPAINMVFVSILALGSVISLALPQLLAQTAEAAVPPDNCFSFSGGTIMGYYDNENNDPGQPACTKSVDIPATIGGNPVTTLGIAAFAGKQLTAITIPTSVTTVGDFAFAGNFLTSLALPDSVTTYGNAIAPGNPITSLSIGTTGFSGTPSLVITSSIFNGVTTLTSITLGNNVLTVDDNAFNGLVANLTSLTLGSSVTSIGNSAFQSSDITSLVIPGSVTTIGEWAFSNSTLTSVTFQEGLEDIGDNAFDGNSLSSVTLPDSVESVGMMAFANNSLTSIDLGSVQILNDMAFAFNDIETVAIPDSVTTLDGAVFLDNPLHSLAIGTAGYTGPALLTIDSSNGFSWGTNGIADLSIGPIVKEIGAMAFGGNNIADLTIPASVTNVGDQAFVQNPLEIVTIEGNPTLSTTAFSYNLIIPSGLGLSGEAAAQYLQDHSVYVQLFASHPAFIASQGQGHIDTATYGSTTYVVSGYIVNPSTFTVRYLAGDGSTLSPQLTSGTGPTLTDYSISANPTGNFSSYYRVGTLVSLAAPSVSGYITPASHDLTLLAGSNSYDFTYVSASAGSNDDSSSNNNGLADTGIRQVGLIAKIGGLLALLGTGSLLLLRRSSLR